MYLGLNWFLIKQVWNLFHAYSTEYGNYISDVYAHVQTYFCI